MRQTHATAAFSVLPAIMLAGCASSVEQTETIRAGEQLFADKGCITCHTVDGTPRVGPSLNGTFGTSVRLADGSELVVDAAYLHESIVHPQARARTGYPPAMPANYAQHLDAREIDALVAYIASLR